MNLFASDPDPTACAQALDTRRVGAQPAEATLILCDSLVLQGRHGGLDAMQRDRQSVADAMVAEGLMRPYNPWGHFARLA